MRPRILASGLAAAQKAAPHLQALAEHLLPAAPGWPLASQNIRSITLRPHADPCALPVAITLPFPYQEVARRSAVFRVLSSCARLSAKFGADVSLRGRSPPIPCQPLACGARSPPTEVIHSAKFKFS
jgi:hypothetical protein